jgi:hypothetical protein
MHSWESGRGREHVGDVEPAASQLAELVRSPTDTMSPTPHALPVAFQRSYGGATDQAAAVRADLAQVAEDFPVADGLVLLASELSTNAMMHSRSGLPGRRSPFGPSFALAGMPGSKSRIKAASGSAANPTMRIGGPQ